MELEDVKKILSEQKLKLDAQNKLLDDYRGFIVQRNNTICELGEKINHRDKKISKLSKVIAKKNKLIMELRDEIDERVTKQVAVFNENQELEKKLSEYANKLADVCDELRELKKKHTNTVVDNVNAQALKSAENALKEKDEVIDDLSKEITNLYKMVHGDPILNMKERKKMGEPLPTADNPNEQCVEPKRNIGHVVILKDDADPTLLRNIFKDMSDIINSEL